MWDRFCLLLWRIWPVGDAAASALAEEVEWEEATEGAKREMDAAAAAKAEAAEAEMEEGAEAQVGVTAAAEAGELEVPRGCGYPMMRIFLICTFRMRKNCILSLQGWSYPQSRVTFFVRTDTYTDCAGRTASVKTCTLLSLQTWRQPLLGC